MATQIWNIQLINDPLKIDYEDPVTRRAILKTCIVQASCDLASWFSDVDVFKTFCESGRVANVALADFVARKLSQTQDFESQIVRLETLDQTSLLRRSTRQRNRRTDSSKLCPFILERTDTYVSHADGKLHVYLRAFIFTSDDSNCSDGKIASSVEGAIARKLETILDCKMPINKNDMMTHVATAMLQDKARFMLSQINAVAFVANGAILPRKSGASTAPMSSPPAIPFAAPENSPMFQTINIEIGKLYQYIAHSIPQVQVERNDSIVTLQGLLVPRGVSLIVGGGYHGKSTLLRCLAAGVYNKVPGDGREYCVTVHDAVAVRAEDGRFVNHCNVSAFISNLPTPSLDTTRFSTGEASGSTSQAANVVEAIEMGASAMLVDEDVSAANFMARDGRMRSLVMDESITPLLYRVNGLFISKGISTIVVVGGVGDWLDVPDAVILMDKYLCKDATAKAQSISKQFSHGHVQYAGRGVVHRLQWEKSTTPTPRRPVFRLKDSASSFGVDTTLISLLDGSDSISLHHLESEKPANSHREFEHNGRCKEIEDDDDENYIDMSRCEQLMGKKHQLYGCGLCLVLLLKLAREHTDVGLDVLLQKLDDALDENGFLPLLLDQSKKHSPSWRAMVETLGYAHRPRRFEVGQALTRFRGVELEAISIDVDDSEVLTKLEAERKKNDLLQIWNNRRKTPQNRFN